MITCLFDIGCDATISTPGSRGASIRHLVAERDRKAVTAVETASQRNHAEYSRVCHDTAKALWIAGQNTHATGNGIARDNTGDIILVNGFYDNKIWDAQIRPSGTIGACIHLHGDGTNQTDIQRNHMWAGANPVAAPPSCLSGWKLRPLTVS